MGLIVSRWSSMLSFTAVLILITASGCKMSSWSMPGMGWLNGGSNETTTQASPNQPAASSQAVPSANASKYLNPPTISTGTPSNFGDATATATKSYPNGRTTAYNGRNTIGPYHPPKSKTVATTQPPAAVSNPQYGSNPGYPRTQYPTAQYPTAQIPAAQYPAAQYPAAQYPTTTPNAGPAYPAKTADARNTTYGAKPAEGNYQRGFYAPERSPAGTFQTQPAPANQLAPTYSNPQPGSFGEGAASSYSPSAPAQISTKPDFALPVTPGSATKTAQPAPYGTDTDPYASTAQSPGAPAAQYPTQSSPAPYRPGSTGRLDPTSVPQQQESFPTRSSQFNAYGN